RTRKWVYKRFAGMQVVFQVHQWKASVNGKEGPFGICSFQRRAATLPEPVTENVQQGWRLLAIGNADDALRPSQLRQLSGLLHVAAQQHQKFGGRARFVLPAL